MPEELPGPTLGELRAASVNMMAAHLAATYLFPREVKAAADRQEFIARAVTVGVDREDAERMADEIREGQSTGRLPLGSGAYRAALHRIYTEGTSDA